LPKEGFYGTGGQTSTLTAQKKGWGDKEMTGHKGVRKKRGPGGGLILSKRD